MPAGGAMRSRGIWLALGCALILLLVAALWLGPLTGTQADRGALTTTTPASTIDAGGRPSARAEGPVLVWVWSTPEDCGELRVNNLNDPHVALCGGPRWSAQFTAEELQTLAGYVARYAPFSATIGPTADGTPSSARLEFAGRGGREPTPDEQAEVASWARKVSDRLVWEDGRRRAELGARLALALRLRVWPDAISTLEVEPTTWPDACLGIDVSWRDCAPGPVAGYRVTLEYAGDEYVYHADVRGLTWLGEHRAAPPPATVAPTAEPTDLPVATETATPQPEPTSAPAHTPTTVPTHPPTVAPTDTPTAVPTPTPSPEPAPPGHWRAEYYDNPDLRGDPVYVAYEPTLSHVWGPGSPAPSVPPDYFSARWSRTIHFEAGRYEFRLEADDGVRLWVAGKLLIDRWYGGHRVDVVSARDVPEGEHEVVVEYFELEADARIHLSWECVDPSPEPERPVAATEEWHAEYFTGLDLAGPPVLVRTEPQVAFDWADGAPHPELLNEGFSARYTREVHLEPGRYRLTAVAQGAVRVYVDDALVIDAWTADVHPVLVRDVTLGGRHTVRVEYHTGAGRAALQVGWACLGQGRSVEATLTPEA